MADLGNFTKGQLERFFAMQLTPLYKKIDELQEKIGKLETKIQNDKMLYTIEETIVLFDISHQTIYNWRKEQKLIAYKIKGRVYFKKEDVEKLINYSKV